MVKRYATPKTKRECRKHSEEFKQEAVKLVSDQQLSILEAARNLGIAPSLLRTWKQRIEAKDEDTSLTEDERMERDILTHDAKTTSVFLDFHRACPPLGSQLATQPQTFFPDFPSDSLRESEGKSGSVGHAVSR